MVLVLIVSFLLILGVVFLAVSLGLRLLEASRKKKVVDMLDTVAGKGPAGERRVVIERVQGGETWVERTLADLQITRTLEIKLQQAGLNWSPGLVFVAMAVGAAVGAFVGWKVNFLLYPLLSSVFLAGLLGISPWLYIGWARNKRMAQIEENFPDALDFLARSMKAGHAFSVSLEMLGKEAPDPLGFEIRRVFNEQNLGAQLDVALRNFAQRIPSLDVRFFVSAVLLQKDTGGNLSEILTGLAYVIRERFKLRGQVKAVSAHGRITALVLTVMPIVLAIALMFVAPDYLPGMAKDPDGRYLIVGAILAMMAGFLWIRKIINIRV